MEQEIQNKLEDLVGNYCVLQFHDGSHVIGFLSRGHRIGFYKMFNVKKQSNEIISEVEVKEVVNKTIVLQ